MSKINPTNALVVRLTNALSNLLSLLNDEELTSLDDVAKYRALIAEGLNAVNKPVESKPNAGVDRVFVDDPSVILDLGRLIGFNEVRDVLGRSSDKYKISGIELALALVDAKTSDFRARQMLINCQIATERGMNINNGELVIGIENGSVMLLMDGEK